MPDLDLLSYDDGQNRAYQHDGITSSILDSFQTSYTSVRGIGWDGANFIGVDYVTYKVYVHAGFSSTISDSFSLSTDKRYGLAFDGTNLYSGGWDSETLYKHDGVSSTILETCGGVITSDVSGLEWDGTNILHCGWATDKVYKHDGFSSTILDSFSLPGSLPLGLAWDGTNLISTDQGTDQIYKHDGFSSTILDSFASPSSKPSALTMMGEAEVQNPPTAPTSLLCEGESAPTSVTDLTPEFSAIYNDPDADDLANAVEIHVATTEGGLGSPDLWDSGWLAITVLEGNRCSDITYGGSALSVGQTYHWKMRFRDDENNEGAWSSPASFSTVWFENWAEKQALFPNARFIYDGVTETARVKSFGLINRASDAIVSGGTSVVLINTDGYWNKFLADRTNLRREAKIQLGIGVLNTIARSGIARSGITASNLVTLAPGSTTSSGIYLAGLGQWVDIFTGWGDDPEFIGSLVVLTLRDKFAGLSEKKLGSEESPLDYFSSAYNPADLAWSMLVTHGGRDSEESSANVDIDYSSWLTWKAACSSVSLSLKARLTGQSILETLELIRKLTNSDICAAGNGKIKFQRFTPAAPPSGVYHFDEDVSRDMSAKLDSGKIINYLRVYYGYNPGTGNWAGNYLEQDADSQKAPPEGYGLSSETLEDKTVWHATSASAASYAGRRIGVYKAPVEVASFQSFAMGMGTEIGDVVKISDFLLTYSEDYFRIHKISSLDVGKCTVNFEAGRFEDVSTVVLDLFEYPSDALVQGAYPTSKGSSPTPRLWSKLESDDDVVTPQLGVGGSVEGQPSYGPVKFLKGTYAHAGNGVKFPTVANNINMDKGTIEFWAKLNFNLPQMPYNAYFFSFRNESQTCGIYFYWDLSIRGLTVGMIHNGTYQWASVPFWPFVPHSVHHFAVVWDRTGSDIGGGKTLVLKVDDVEIASSSITKGADSNINPYIYLSTDRHIQQILYGGVDNFKAYDVCKTDFSDRNVEDPNALQCYSDPTTKYQGSYSMRIFARAATSLNETLIRTVYPTIDLSNMNKIKFAVQASRAGANFRVTIRSNGAGGVTRSFLPNILTANTWQVVDWDWSGIANGDKDAVNQIKIEITNADADNWIFIDKMEAFA